MSTHKSNQVHSNRAIAQSASVIGFATLCSRLLGFLRDMVIARLFGVYIYAQAFVIALRIPNLFRDLVGEGAANAAFVPVFSQYNAKNTKQEFWELVNVVLNLLLVALMAITIIGILLAPVIVRLIAPGFVASAEKLEITIRLTRIIFPYVVLVCLAAYSMAVLNSLRHFSIPAFAPCLLNISIIVFVLLGGQGIAGLATGVLVGGLLQLAVQMPLLYKKGFRPKLFREFKHPQIKHIGMLILPRIASSSIYQLNNFVDSIFGSLAWIVGEGGVVVLYLSYRLIQFPLGIFSYALSQAILPTFSTQVAEENYDRLKQTLSWSLRATFFALVPASVGLIVLSGPIIATLFKGGRFDLNSTYVTANALCFYAIGLFAYGATRILQFCFFALKDTKTPAKVAFLALVINVILNSIFIWPFKIAGVAFATSISGIITFIILFNILKKRLRGLQLKGMITSFLRILIASMCMGLILLIISSGKMPTEINLLSRFLNLGILITIGFISYIFFCLVFRVNELKQLWGEAKRSFAYALGKTSVP